MRRCGVLYVCTIPMPHEVTSFSTALEAAMATGALTPVTMLRRSTRGLPVAARDMERAVVELRCCTAAVENVAPAVCNCLALTRWVPAVKEAAGTCLQTQIECVADQFQCA